MKQISHEFKMKKQTGKIMNIVTVRTRTLEERRPNYENRKYLWRKSLLSRVVLISLTQVH